MHQGPVGQVNGADGWEGVSGLIPSATAAASTNVLKVEPGWRRACETRLYWFLRSFGITPTIALIAPFRGSIETSADAGSVRSVSVLVMAARAWRCSRGLIVV